MTPEDDPPLAWLHEYVMASIRRRLQQRRQEVAELERMRQAGPDE
ncbi:hypothetical protein [Planomonospora sp. ID91781]|nr:hypothetical protein [Planomonospora sp. ID91781]